MSVFLVLPTGSEQNIAALNGRIGHVIPAGDALGLPRGAWLISYSGTSRALSDALGVSEGETSGGLVVGVSGYWGRASNDVWEWLKLKQGT